MIWIAVCFLLFVIFLMRLAAGPTKTLPTNGSKIISSQQNNKGHRDGGYGADGLVYIINKDQAKSFDFDAALSSSIRETQEIKRIEKEQLYNKSFLLAVKYIAKVLLNGGKSNIVISPLDVGFSSLDNIDHFQVFKAEFSKLCSEKGITIIPNIHSLELDRISLIEYREKLGVSITTR